MKHLYVCRHGESELNMERRYSGQTETPLTERGREQARAAGEQADGLDLDLIVSSTLGRAVETAQIIARSAGYPADHIITTALAVERSYGSLEGKSWDIAADMQRVPDMESPEALSERARQTLDYLRGRPEANILLVSHGSFLIALRKLIDPSASAAELPNATIVQFV